MPLSQSASESALDRNIRQLIEEGYPQKQAIAIALETQRRLKNKMKQEEPMT